MSEDSLLIYKGKLEKEIVGLEARLVDLKARLPAHSIPAGMIAEMDELDERLASARAQLAALQGRNDNG
jgi:hypothetical protein